MVSDSPNLGARGEKQKESATDGGTTRSLQFYPMQVASVNYGAGAGDGNAIVESARVDISLVGPEPATWEGAESEPVDGVIGGYEAYAADVASTRFAGGKA